MHRNAKLSALACAALLLLAGCATPKHTDLLVFGTNTSFGVSVKGDATSTAGVDIGYHRQEVVLMPLYVNANESKYQQASAPSLADAKYQGVDSEARKDTYSVLASFGAKGGAAAGKADVTIAQYFATGLAARTLAVAGGSLVSTSDIAADASKTTSAAAAAVATQSPAVKALLDASKRLEHEAAVTKAFNKLSADSKTDLLRKLNAMFSAVHGTELTADNFQPSLQHMSDDQLDYTKAQLP